MVNSHKKTIAKLFGIYVVLLLILLVFVNVCAWWYLLPLACCDTCGVGYCLLTVLLGCVFSVCVIGLVILAIKAGKSLTI